MEDKKEPKSDSVSQARTPKSKTGRVERVVLRHEVISQVDEWISQFERKQPALKISRQDIVNFVILGHPVELSDEELSRLQGSHFNAIRYSQWVTQKIKDATARGETVTREELFKLYANCHNGECHEITMP